MEESEHCLTAKDSPPERRMDDTGRVKGADLEAWLEAQKQKTRVRLSVSFKHLNVNGFTTSTFFQRTFASYLLTGPTYLKTLVGWGERRKVHILRDINGLVRSGEMLLVLGRPGSGCTTFLKTMAGNAHGVEVDESAVNYQGIPWAEMHRKCRADSIYLSEGDIHFPELTLRETLAFAAEMRPHEALSKEVGRQIAAVFNLDRSLDTRIGDDLIRGLSGGEKKRTSIAEAFISGGRIQCWDNSTRGLDSSTALDFVSTLRSSADALGSTVMISIYQASEAMYDRFDKVLLLYEGRQVYFGSAARAAEYFTHLGFTRPARATTADFLTSLTHPAERIIRDGYEDRVPRTPDEFAETWRQSPEYQRLSHELDDFNETYPVQDGLSQQYLRNKYAVEANARPPTSICPTSISHQVRICIQRAFIRLRNNLAAPISNIIGNTIVAVILGSVFYDLSEDTGSFETRGILLFYATMINACLPAFEVLAMWAQRPIVEKHSRYAFYHPVAEGVASMIADLPNKLITSIFFNVCLYFLTNLRRTASAFFTFWILSFVAMVTMSMLFRMVGSLSRTYEQSLAPVAIMIINFIIYAGFVIPPQDQKPWLSWIRWIDPIGYTYESLMINEFGDRRFVCSDIVPSGPEYNQTGMDGKICAAVGAIPGNDFVEGNDFLQQKYGYPRSHLWRNFGLLFVMMIGFCFIHLLAAEYIQAQKSKGDILLFRRKHVARYLVEDEESGEVSVHVDEKGDVKPAQSGLSEKKPDIFGGLQENSSTFHWSDVCYDVKVGKESRRILDEIDGWVKPGTLTALLGATGAGKTTLLDVLADRKSVGIIRGNICIDGRARDMGFQRKTGYVQQADLHLPTATVREALEFSAVLRQSRSRSTAEKLAYVDTVLSALEMDSYADAVVGVPGKGLNIEQRKRLTIAVEMAARPELLLFLDEPTSGLDSQTAWSICTLLRKLADNGQAILCTIHQPSAELFQIFDRLLLLGGGKTLYFGDIGSSASTVISYFEDAGARPYKEGENPSEWLLEVTGTQAAFEGSSDWSRIWHDSPERGAVKRQLSMVEHPATETNTESRTRQRGQGHDEYAASLLQQLCVVTHRIFQAYWRDPTYLYSKFALCVGTALFNGFSFWMVSKDIQGLTSTLFSCFLLMVIFQTIDQQIIPRFLDGRALFEAREKQSKTYSWVAFIAANIIVEIVWQSLTSVLVFVAWYYPTGLWKNGDGSFGMNERAGLIFLVIWLFFVFTPTLSQAIAAGMEDAQTAVNVAQLLFSLCLIFCGILVQPGNLPHFWIFMYRVSPITYLIDAMVVAGLANTEVECASVELLRINLPANSTSTCGQYLSSYLSTAGGRLLNPDSVEGCLYCELSDTNLFLNEVGIGVHDGWRDMGILAAYVVINILGTFLIYWSARVSKSKKV